MFRMIAVFLISLFLYCGNSGTKPNIEELFAQGQELQKQHKYLEAIDVFEQIIDGFPKNKHTAHSQFMIAFIYSENLKDYVKAREEFKKFISEYPQNQLVESAKWQLENMGKTPEELDFFIKDSIEKNMSAPDSSKE